LCGSDELLGRPEEIVAESGQVDGDRLALTTLHNVPHAVDTALEIYQLTRNKTKERKETK
jgi:hypothetical protein